LNFRKVFKPLDLRRVACLDLETPLIRPGLCSPPVSVCSIFRPGLGPQLFGTFELEREVSELLDSDWIIVGHNIAYDMLCLFEWYPRLRKLIIQAYEDGRILDTGLLWRIIEISKGDMRGGLALDRLCQMVGLKHESKHQTDEDGEELRLGFGKHWGTDLSAMTPDEVQYCQDDVVLCWRLFERIWEQGWCTQKDLAKLCRTDFALKAVSGFGLRADPEIVNQLEQQATLELAQLAERCIENGFMRRERNKPAPVRTLRNIQQAVADAFRIPVRCGEGRNRNRLYPNENLVDVASLVAMGIITDTGAISTGKGVLRESGDEDLIVVADYQEWAAVLNKDVKLFKYGIFHTRFGYANTLRTTSSRPNIQNFRKKAGVRECLRALWGCYVASDYVGLENGTLAELIVRYTGRCGMADRISAGFDYHCEVGRLIDSRHLSYDEFKLLVDAGDSVAKLARGAAKPLNFGLPGNMRKPQTFQQYARDGYGVKLTLARAQELMELWWETQHDQMAYLDFIETFKVDPSDRWSLYAVPIPGTDIIRRGCTSCAAANTGFQALGMQTAADALWYVVVGQLMGEIPGRVCAFVHDELISDCKPLDRDQVAYHHNKGMLWAAEENLPNVRMSVDHTAMDRWTKDFPKGWKKHNPDGSLNLYQVAA
jgi:hypothetical protein